MQVPWIAGFWSTLTVHGSPGGHATVVPTLVQMASPPLKLIDKPENPPHV